MTSVRSTWVLSALTCLLLACTRDDDAQSQIPSDSFGEATALLHGPLFSTYDGVHDNQFTAIAVQSMLDFDLSQLIWTIPDDFLRSDPVEGRPEVRLLTPKRAGKGEIGVRGRSREGKEIRGHAAVVVTEADQALWDVGKARYEEQTPIDWQADAHSCGLPIPAEPQAASCGSCHSEQPSKFGASLDQSKTTYYSDDDLIEIIVHGAKPAGAIYESPFLREAPMPDCAYKRFHSAQLSDDEQHGIVAYIRSLKPRL